jgi:hypothetical protein
MNCNTLGLTPIPSPTSLPPGFQTSGAYLRESITGATSVRLPVRNDEND